ncbi:putative ribonuclease H-like domain-containing protein [Tanacetum coccineum]
MLAPKGSTYNGRPTFANPMYLKKAQSEKPCLYEIPYNTSDLANRCAPDRDETLTLEQESRSKLNKDKIVQLIIFIVDSGCTKHMTGNLKLLCNFVEKYLDLQGNDLLTDNRGSDLYIMTLQETTSPTLIYFMAKASPTQAWLWHCRLSHLNFDTINLLTKKDIMIGLPKLKYVKDQLYSSCKLSKAKRSTFKTKTAPSSKEWLNLLHMDLCGPVRIESINGNKYILNGVVERRNHTLVEAARTMLSASKLPLFFWAEAIATAYGENINKMKENRDSCILVGYSTQSKGYRVYNKRTRLIVESIHINFDEIKELSKASDYDNIGHAPQLQRTSDHNRSELDIQDHINEPSSSTLVPNVSSQANTANLLNTTPMDCRLEEGEEADGDGGRSWPESGRIPVTAPDNLEREWGECLEVMEFESAQRNTTAKLTLLKQMSVPVTAEEKTNKKNDVKARSLLLMALPNEHQLTFSQYSDAKTMFAAIKTRFGDVKKSIGASSGAQNLTFLTTPSTSSTNDVNTANHAYERKFHEDDLEAMDLKWQLSLLSMRAKRYFQRSRKKIFINANDTDGYDKSKVECFNYHKMGHFARECRAPRNKEGQFKYQDNTRKQGNNEDTSSKAMLAIDGVEEQLITYRKNEVLFSEEVAVLKREVACKDYEINVLKSEFEKVKQEKEGIEFKIEKFDNASKSLDKLLGSQITDKNPEFKSYGFKDSKQESNIVCDKKSDDSKENSDDSLVKEQVHFKYHQREMMVYGNNYNRVNYNYTTNMTHPNAQRNTVPRAVLMKTGLKPFNTARTVNTAHPKSTVFSAKPMPRFSKSAQSTVKRPYQSKTILTNKKFTQKNNTVKAKAVNTARPKAVNTARPHSAVVNAVRVNQAKAVKASACWVWRPTKRDIQATPRDGTRLLTVDAQAHDWEHTISHISRNLKSEILKNFIKEIENLVDKKVKIIRSDNGTEFKNKVMDDFCREKGIKREYSVARTPKQNGVAERRNKTLIEAARTMLADSKLPTTFWAEAVSTACYVQNRVLVVKPHNKTPYELFRGFKPALSFMRPFGCHVTILNSLDNLGKFDGKSDEGFFVGYSLSSKAFRVYNTRTRRVEENLHIWFLENKPMIEGNGPKWLFDIDSLTESMNYVLVAAGTILNESAGTQGGLNAEASSPSKDVGYGEPKSADDDQKQVEDGPHNESDEKDKSEDDSSHTEVNAARQHVNTTSPEVNTSCFKLNNVDPSVNTASSYDPDSPKDMFKMGASHILEATHVEFFSDEDEPEVDLGNITNSYIVLITPNTRIYKDHPIKNVIGDVKSSIQTRTMKKSTSEQGFLSAVYEQKTHDTLNTCLYACFLSQIEPISIAKALSDSSWVEAMQEKLL